MAKYIFLLIMAVFAAQLLITSIAVWFVQTKNPKITYPQAVKLYIHGNIARYVVVAAATLVLCFLLVDYLDLSMSHNDLKHLEKLTRAQQIQLNFRLYAIAVGSFIEILAVLFYKIGWKKINDFGKSQGIDDAKSTTP
jgi:uncharacterized membrane protein